MRFVGFFRPVLGVSFNGEVGAEKAWEVSKSCEVAGRGRTTAFMLSDRFLTFLVLSTGGVGCGGKPLVNSAPNKGTC